MKRPSKAWPAPLNKRAEPGLPAWGHHDLYPHGIFPMPDKLEEFNEERFQDYGRKVAHHFEECDRIENDEKERSLAVLMEFLGVRTNDYKSGFLRYLEQFGPPAFKKAETRGAKPGKKAMRLLKLLGAIEEIQRRNPDFTDVEALQEHDPELKKTKARNKLIKQTQYLSGARAMFRLSAPAKSRNRPKAQAMRARGAEAFGIGG